MTDPGSDTFSAGTPSCGASGDYVLDSLVFSSVTGDGTFECLFADDNPTATASDLSTVSITITDDDTGATTAPQIVTVNNVAPTVVLSGAAPVNEGETTTIHLHHHRPRQRHVLGRHAQLRPQRHPAPTAWSSTASRDGTFMPVRRRQPDGHRLRLSTVSRSPTTTPARPRAPRS